MGLPLGQNRLATLVPDQLGALGSGTAVWDGGLLFCPFCRKGGVCRLPAWWELKARGIPNRILTILLGSWNSVLVLGGEPLELQLIKNHPRFTSQAVGEERLYCGYFLFLPAAHSFLIMGFLVLWVAHRAPQPTSEKPALTERGQATVTYLPWDPFTLRHLHCLSLNSGWASLFHFA